MSRNPVIQPTIWTTGVASLRMTGNRECTKTPKAMQETCAICQTVLDALNVKAWHVACGFVKVPQHLPLANVGGPLSAGIEAVLRPSRKSKTANSSSNSSRPEKRYHANEGLGHLCMVDTNVTHAPQAVFPVGERFFFGTIVS